jgi:hypothetical protein
MVMVGRTIIMITIVVAAVLFVIAAVNRKKKDDEELDEQMLMDAYLASYNESMESGESDSFGGGILQSDLTTGSIAGDIAANIGVSVAVDVIKNKIIRKVGERVGSRAIFKSNARIAKGAGKVLSKIASKNPLLLVKLGSKMGKGAAKVASKMAGTAVVSGSLATLKGASPLIIFDAVSMIMDLADVGGYGTLSTRRVYQEMRRSTEEMLKEELSKMDPPISYPIVISPIDSITGDEELLMKELNLYMTADFARDVPLDPEINKMMSALNSDIENNTINADDNYYYSMMDLDVLIDNMLDSKCTELGGELVEGNCTFTAAGCEARNTWPMSEDSEELYSEFDKVSKQCILAGASERALCESNGLVYNLEDRVCEFTEEYCKTKAAEFVDGDCEIPTEQAVLGLIFGDTIVNGLKQVFDLDQYEECPYYGEITAKVGTNETCLNVTGDSVNMTECNGKMVQQFFYVPRTKTIHAMGKDNWIFTLKTDETPKAGDTIELKKISEDKITELQMWNYNKETKQFTLHSYPDFALNVNMSEVTIQPKSTSGSQKFNVEQSDDTTFSVLAGIGGFFTGGPVGAALAGASGRLVCTITDFGRIADCPEGYNASSDLNLDCSIPKPTNGKCPEGDIDTWIFGTCIAANNKMVCKDTEFLSGSRCYTEPPPMFEHGGGIVAMTKRRVIQYSRPDN